MCLLLASGYFTSLSLFKSLIKLKLIFDYLFYKNMKNIEKCENGITKKCYAKDGELIFAKCLEWNLCLLIVFNG